MSPKTRKRRPTKSDLLYQFKITLLDIKPAIWRRIQVPDCTLADLHEYIQAAFGWWNYHLHQFEIDGRLYGDPLMERTSTKDSRSTTQADRNLRGREAVGLEYEYDFGDGWRHEVLFEGRLEPNRGSATRSALRGHGPAHLRTWVGSGGMRDVLAAIADTQHEDHEKWWSGRGPFDPEVRPRGCDQEDEAWAAGLAGDAVRFAAGSSKGSTERWPTKHSENVLDWLAPSATSRPGPCSAATGSTGTA